MSGDDRTRFCRECDKQVYDFSRMTRGEIEKLLACAHEGLCARFSRRADGTMETADPLTGSIVTQHSIPFRVSAPLSAILSLCASAFAQSPTKLAEPQQQRPPYVLQREHIHEAQNRTKTTRLHGTIFDPLDAVIPEAEITLIDEKTKQEYSATTDNEGIYRFSNLQPGSYSFTATSRGFRVFSKSQLDLKAGEEVRLDATLQLGALMGEIVTVKKHSSLTMLSKGLLFPYHALKRITGTSH